MCVVLVGALVLAAAGFGGNANVVTMSSSPASTVSGQLRKCRGVTVKLGGKRVCVAAGRPCQSKYERTYERLGFTCRGGFLYRRIITPDAQVVATIPVGSGPAAIRYLDGSIWVLNDFDGTLSRINPATDAVVATIPVAKGTGDIAFGDGSIWVVAEELPTLFRIDPSTNSVTTTIPTQGIRPMGIAWTPGAIWVGHHGHDADKKATVVRIDTTTNQVVRQTGVGVASVDSTGGPTRMTAAFGSVWVGVSNGGELDRIDPTTNAVTRIPAVSCDSQLEAVGGSLWFSEGCSDIVHRLDPATNTIVGKVTGPPTGGTIFPLAVDGTFLWATTFNKQLLKIDPVAAKIVGRWHHPAEGIFGAYAPLTAGAGSIWVSDSPHNRVLRLQP